MDANGSCYIITYLWSTPVCYPLAQPILAGQPLPHCPLHRGAFCQFPFQWIYYFHISKSTGKETDKMHLCALYCTSTWPKNFFIQPRRQLCAQDRQNQGGKGAGDQI